MGSAAAASAPAHTASQGTVPSAAVAAAPAQGEATKTVTFFAGIDRRSNLMQTTGIAPNFRTGVVEKVIPGSPAAEAGVKIGWRFLTVNGESYTFRLLNDAHENTGQEYEVTFQV